MTDLQLLINRINQEPDSDIGAAMLIDELMDAKGMLYTEAARHVETVRAIARTNLQIEFTAGLIRAKGPAYDKLINELHALFQLDGDAVYGLFVVAGDDPPHFSVPNGASLRWPKGHEMQIALPAGWVCAWFRRQTVSIHPVKNRK